MKKTLIASIIVLMCGSTSMAWAQNKYTQQDTAPAVNMDVGVEQVMSSSLIKSKISGASDVSRIRSDVLIQMASEYGVSRGLAWKIKKINNEEIAKEAKRLDMYDFAALAIYPGVLPPVVEEGLSNYAQNSPDEIRVSDKRIRIVADAKFVSEYPTWRDYLIFKLPNYQTPPAAFLPQSPAEAAIWDEWASKGWETGVAQAMQMFQASLDRIDRDFNGMLKFKQLLAQGVMTATVVAKQNLGVTGGGREIVINDQIGRIVDHSALIGNPKEWKVDYPATFKGDGKYK